MCEAKAEYIGTPLVRFLELVLSIAVLVLDRKSIDIESFVDKDWIGYLRPFEYEYEEIRT